MPNIVRRIVFLVLAGFVIGVAGSASALAAQRVNADGHTVRAQRFPFRSSVRPFSDADSVRIMDGHLSFAAYRTPGECLAAAEALGRLRDRPVERDTQPQWTRPGKMTPAQVELARACAAPFTVSGASVRELENYLELALSLGDETTARAVVERLLTLDRTKSDSAITLVDAIHAYLGTPAPDGVTDAQLATFAGNWLDTLDALGPSVWQSQLSSRFALHRSVAGRAVRDGRWEPASRLKDALALVRRCDAIPPANRAQFQRAFFLDLGSLTSEIFEAKGFLNPHGVAAFADSLRKASVTFADMTDAAVKYYAKQYDEVGTFAPPVKGDFWYNAGPVTSRPRANTVSLILERARQLDPEQYAFDIQLRRLMEKYAARGLETTVLARTTGYSPWGGLLTPAQEAAEDSVYFLDYLKFPATLIVGQSTFVTQPDGHVIATGSVAYEPMYGGRRNAVVVDRHGKIVTVSSVGAGSTLLVLEAYIILALNQ